MSKATEALKLTIVVFLIFVMAMFYVLPNTYTCLVLSYNPAVIYTTWLSSAIKDSFFFFIEGRNVEKQYFDLTGIYSLIILCSIIVFHRFYCYT